MTAHCRCEHGALWYLDCPYCELEERIKRMSPRERAAWDRKMELMDRMLKGDDCQN